MIESADEWPPSYTAYGITLQPVDEQDLELIRNWRNDPQIQQHMLDKTHITASAQQAWFAKIKANKQQIYWLLYFKNNPIGVASLTNIDRSKGTVEPGMYIYSEQYRNNIVPYCAAFALNDFAFTQLNLSRLEGKIFANNSASLRFHESTGYKKYAESDNGLYLYSLDRDSYCAARDKIARFIRY